MADDLQEWQTHPVAGTPEAATSLSATTGQPEWMQHAIAPPPPEPPQPVDVGLGTGFVPKFLAKQGNDLTFGLADKAEAALEAGIHALVPRSPSDLVTGDTHSFSDTYHKRLGEIRGEQEQFSQTNPIASDIAAGTGVAGSVAALPSEGIAATAGLLPKLVEGAKMGGVAGGMAGFGGSSDESVTGDLAATGVGAGLGAGIGAGGAAIADRVVAPVMNWVARRFSPEAVQSQAVQAIAKRMGQDADAGGPSAQDMLDLINAAPDKPQALADVAGENTQQYAGRIARQPGEGRAVARQALNTRDVGAGPRIAGDIDTGISAGGSAFDTNQALMQARSAAAAPRYDAMQDLQLWSPRLQQFLDDPVMRQGLNRGMELERLDSVTQGRPFDPTAMGIDLDADGNVAFRSVPNMRVLDAGKRGLDLLIAEERNPMTGRLSQRGVSLDQFRRAYVGQLDDLDTSGTYAAARASWAGPSASMDAVRAGQAILNKRPEEIAGDMANLEPGNQEFYRLGAADALKEKIAKTGMGGDEAKRIIGNQYTQNQLRPLFDQQPDFDRFINSVTAENRMFETRQKLIGGSQSAERLAEDAGGNPEAAGHAIKAGAFMAAGEPIAGGLSAMKALGALMRGESPDVNAAASRILFTPQSMNSPTVFQNLRQVVEAQQARTRPRLLSIPGSATVGANPVPILSTLPALGIPGLGSSA